MRLGLHREEQHGGELESQAVGLRWEATASTAMTHVECEQWLSCYSASGSKYNMTRRKRNGRKRNVQVQVLFRSFGGCRMARKTRSSRVECDDSEWQSFNVGNASDVAASRRRRIFWMDHNRCHQHRTLKFVVNIVEGEVSRS